MGHPAMMAVALLMATTSLGGCLTAYNDFADFDPDEHYRNVGVFEGSYLRGNGGAKALVSGTLVPPLYPDVHILESERPHYGPAAGLMGDESKVNIVIAVWHPDNYTAKRPVIVDAGPYYEQAGGTIEQANQSTPFLLQNMLPLGYSVAQIAVRGTGTAGGCVDLFGPDETADLDQALTWLGTQEWSNGNIAMMGVSYDGSTPWTAAGTGNPYLKTIIPISGLPDIYDLMFHNGSAETRGPMMHGPLVYWSYGFSPNMLQEPDGWLFPGLWVPGVGLGSATHRESYQDRQNLLCPDAYEGQAMGAYATAGLGRGSPASTYFAERDHRQRVLDNYKGSVFLIHGLQDWNVDPHAAIPFNQKLRDAGLEVKQWYGQWDHARPDTFCVPNVPQWAVMPCRMDYGDVMYRWFEKYLRGNTTIDTGPAIQVQDSLGVWRNADSYPPTSPDWIELKVGAQGKLGEGAQSGEVLLPTPGRGDVVVHQVVSEPFDEGLHFSGLPQLKLPFSTTGGGGHIAAWLFDLDPDDRVRAPMVLPRLRTEDMNQTEWVPAGVPVVGHAQMNLQYHAGGETQQAMVPGQRYVAQIEFEPLEVHIPEGHRLGMWIFQYHYPDRMDSATPGEVTLHLDDAALLRLPGIDLDPRTVFPVPGVRFPESTYTPEMYVPMPILPGVDAPSNGELMRIASDVASAVERSRSAQVAEAGANEAGSGVAPHASKAACSVDLGAVSCGAP